MLARKSVVLVFVEGLDVAHHLHDNVVGGALNPVLQALLLLADRLDRLLRFRRNETLLDRVECQIVMGLEGKGGVHFYVSRTLSLYGARSI